MVTALVLIKAETGMERSIIEELRKIPEVTESHLLLGVYDISVKIKVAQQSDLAVVVSQKIRAVPGIIDTKTLPTMSFSSF